MENIEQPLLSIIILWYRDSVDVQYMVVQKQSQLTNVYNSIPFIFKCFHDAARLPVEMEMAKEMQMESI